MGSLEHMIVFIGEERAYWNWVTHHRQGFVLDGRRGLKPGHFVLHRASCAEMRRKTSNRSHWTTGGRFKSCASTPDELQQWSTEHGQTWAFCDICRPHEATAHLGSASLTKLAGDILDYVVEAALIHFELEYPPYRLCVGDIAACFAKTPGQLSASLRQLIEQQLIIVRARSSHPDLLDSKTMVYPTLAGLRTLASLAEEGDAALTDQLNRL